MGGMRFLAAAPRSAAPLFQMGAFELASGQKSMYKIDCHALTLKDWDTLAFMGACIVGSFSQVEGVPRGGLLFAKAMEHYAIKSGPLLIVDDVLTTGESMERQRDGREAIGLVAFARATPPSWVRACWTLGKGTV